MKTADSHPKDNTFKFAAIGLGVLAVVVVLTFLSFGKSALTRATASNGAKFSLSTPRLEPEFKGISTWINSKPLTLAELKGKVVLVDFWTYSCINCIRNNPYIEKFYEKYKSQGLVVIGVHSPEFAFEKVPDNVREAVKKYGLTYPIAMDNEMSTWNAFQNNSWPAGYFIDREGKIRNIHLGEGEYANSELVIQALLAENKPGYKAPLEKSPEGPPISQDQTLETYLNYSRGQDFLNSAEFMQDKTVTYKGLAAGPLQPSEWSLLGAWKVGKEGTTSENNDSHLLMKFSAKELYLVMGSKESVTGKVLVNGSPMLAGEDVQPDGSVTISGARLYRLVKSDSFVHDGVLDITVPAGVEVNAFTFGS